jgi:hypothetical protein
MKKFSKKLMMARLEKENRLSQVTSEAEAIMDDLDGQEAITSNWRRQVYGEPVYWVVGKSGAGQYVAEADCE